MTTPLQFQGTPETQHLLTQHFSIRTDNPAQDTKDVLKLTETGNTFTLSSLFGTEDFEKPLSLQALKQHYNRICARLTRTWKIGPWFFEEDGQMLFADKTIKLSEKEVHILKALIQEPEGLGKAALLTRIWGHDDTIETRTLESHIYATHDINPLVRLEIFKMILRARIFLQRGDF